MTNLRPAALLLLLALEDQPVLRGQEPRRHDRRRVRSRAPIRCLLAVLALTAVAGCAGGYTDQRGNPPPVGDRPELSCPATSCAWRELPVPRLGVSMSLTGMAVLPDGEVWLAGQAGAGWSKPRPWVDTSWAPAPSHDVMLHRTGSTWTRVRLPRLTEPLADLTPSPRGVIWAVEGEHLAEYDGRRWVERHGLLPVLGWAGFVGLAMDATGGWAATTAGGRRGNGPWTARWDGRRWHPVPTPRMGIQSGLTAIASAPGGEAWAFGSHDVRGPPGVNTTREIGLLIEHWAGGRWRIVPEPVYRNTRRTFFIAAATMLSARDGWAVGSQVYSGGGRIHPLVLHYDGRSWANVRFPYCCAAALLTAVAGHDGRVWVAGNATGPSGPQTLIARWDGRTWVREPSLNRGGSQVAAVGLTRRGAPLVAATGANSEGTNYPLVQRRLPGG